jgi:hypothetical protein
MISQNMVRVPLMVGQTMFLSKATVHLFSINSTTCFGPTVHYQVGKNGRRICNFEWKSGSQLLILQHTTYSGAELNNHVSHFRGLNFKKVNTMIL